VPFEKNPSKKNKLCNNLAFKPKNNITANSKLCIKTKHKIKVEDLFLYNDGPDDEEYVFNLNMMNEKSIY